MAAKTLPEHWTALHAARSQRSLCAADVDKLKNSCAEVCGKQHITQCKDCYGKVLERTRKRYSGHQEKEWFSQRRAFLQELDDLFVDAKDYKCSIKTIEAHIESDKEAWYRWVLRGNPAFLEIAEHEVPPEEMRGMLGDPDRSREELVAMMWQGVGKPEDWSDAVDAFVEKVSALKGQSEGLKQLYIDEFFKHKDGRVVDHAQPYLDEYQASDEMTLEQVVGRIIADKHQDRSSQKERDMHASRLDELRRARTAFEQKRKESKALLQKAQARPELYNLPPCAVCKGIVSTQEVFSCSLCQAIVQMGGSGTLTVFCSEECCYKGQDQHNEKEHDCSAGELCVQLTDEDIDMSDDPPQAFLCKECINDKRATVYCSERCASERLGMHLKEAHGADSVADTRSTAVPFAEAVGSLLSKANPTLKIEQVS